MVRLYHGIVVRLARILGCLQLDALTLHQVTLLVVVTFQVIDPAQKKIIPEENNLISQTALADFHIKP